MKLRFRLGSALAALSLLAVLSSGNFARADDLNLGGSYTYPITYTGDGGGTVGGGSIVQSYLNGNVLPWVYCVGLFTNVGVPADYANTIVTTNGNVNGATVHDAANIAYLLVNYANAYIGNTGEQAALQGAIWTLEYGIVVTGLPDNTYLSLYNTLVTAGTNHTAPVSDILWLSPHQTPGDGPYQGLVTAVAVPEPSSLAIAGLSGLGLLLYARRRSR